MDMVRTTDQIIYQIGLLLAGHNPAIQGAVIAELLGIFLASHAPSIRNEICDATIEMAWHIMALHDAWREKT
jgi:hypothetical protein